MPNDKNMTKDVYVNIKETCFEELKNRRLLSTEYEDLLEQELQWLEKEDRIVKFNNSIKIGNKLKELDIDYMTNIMGSLCSYLLGISEADPVKNKLYPSSVFFRDNPSYCFYVPLHLVELIMMRFSLDVIDAPFSLLEYQYIENLSNKKVITHWVISEAEETKLGFSYDGQSSTDDDYSVYLMGFPKLSANITAIKINKNQNILYGEDYMREVANKTGLAFHEINHLAKVAYRSEIDSFYAVLKKYKLDSHIDNNIEDLYASFKGCLTKHYWATLLD